ncbi:hypothetical protein EBZ39_17190 [bacterium]|nr:hypothetical protein [bacterium]
MQLFSFSRLHKLLAFAFAAVFCLQEAESATLLSRIFNQKPEPEKPSLVRCQKEWARWWFEKEAKDLNKNEYYQVASAAQTHWKLLCAIQSLDSTDPENSYIDRAQEVGVLALALAELPGPWGREVRPTLSRALGIKDSMSLEEQRLTQYSYIVAFLPDAAIEGMVKAIPQVEEFKKQMETNKHSLKTQWNNKTVALANQLASQLALGIALHRRLAADSRKDERSPHTTQQAALEKLFKKLTKWRSVGTRRWAASE